MAITASPIVLMIAPLWRATTSCQQIEMPLDEGEGIEVADAIRECGRPFEIGEQKRDVLDPNSLPRLDDLGAEEEIVKGLRG